MTDSPDGPSATYSLAVTALVTVKDGEVTRITLLPSQDKVRSHHLYEGTDSDEARAAINEHIWPPLLALPDSIVWEG